MSADIVLHERISHYKNGRVNLRYYIHPETNKRHGVLAQYHATGHKYSVAEYHHGKLHGTRTTYFFESDMINTTANYKHGKLHGPMIYYDLTGVSCVSEYYIEGTLIPNRLHSVIKDINNITEEERTILALHGVAS